MLEGDMVWLIDAFVSFKKGSGFFYYRCSAGETVKHNFRSCVWSILLAFVFVDAFSLYAAEPPKDPILRIESGMHTAMIPRIGLDAENRYLVTASNDKTVGVWDAGTGMLIRRLRPPVGEGYEGKIFAVAIFPDGSTVAAGGWTGWHWDKSNYIYLFDRSTGRLKQRITGLPNVILHLAFSKDGRYLVACLGRNSGIRLYRTSDYSLAGEDRDYGDNSYGADFDRNGRLVTTSYDGFIRLYSVESGSLRLIAKKKGRGGDQPCSVSLSPFTSSSDTKIAVGYYDSTKVDVLSGRDLSYLYSPDTTGINNGYLSSVAWSSDGNSLYAGGLHPPGIRQLIRKWNNTGKGSYIDILSGADDTIMHILPLKNGGIAFGAADPAFGIINGSDEKTVFKSSYIAVYRGNQEGLLLAHDGLTVQFGYEVLGKSPATFSVSERSLDTDLKTRNSGLKPPVIQASGMNITDWKYTTTPKLNGKALKLEQYERSSSLVIAPSGGSFILGADWSLRLFDRNGNELWKAPIPGAAWAVNISGDGRVAVAALADGTIRWYRMTDGKELLALFPHKDRKRWVIWSPMGYYDASAGADELIGWHVNNGKDSAADFFPASRFRASFYRPDVIARVLEAGSEYEAVKWANDESGRKKQKLTIRQQLPPVVSIIAPYDNQEIQTTEVIVRYSVRTPSGEPVTGIKALVDGRPVSSERGITLKPKDGETSELRVTVPSKHSEVSIIAENRYSTSEPSTVRLRWAGKVQKDEFTIQPKLYVLSIGVSKYEDKDLTLQYAGKDARDFAAAMQKQKGALYRDVVTKVLTDKEATKDEILDGLDWLRKETTGKDIAMVFLAGHGINDQSGIYYYLPANANLERLMRTGVAFSDIKNTVASLAGKTVLFVDTCHSGNVMGTRRGVADINAVVNELASAENGAVVFASSTGKQYSLEDAKWGNGAFTKALVEGIGGKADYTNKGRITINMLDLYLSESVKELTGGKQTPTTTKANTVPDFPIAVKK